MEAIKTILIAIIQGISEFLPISSSGHIVLFEDIFNFSGNSIPSNDATLEVVLHLGTLMSILIFFKSDILSLLKGIIARDKDSAIYSIYVVIATVPVVIFYLLTDYFGYDIESLFRVETLIYTFLFNALILYATKYVNPKKIELSFVLVIAMGLAQVLALLPGISRSGTTICIALLFGCNQKIAAKFSFFMFIPAILGVLVLKLSDIQSNIEISMAVLGFLFSMITGLLVLKLLFKILENQKLWMFSFYSLIIWLISIMVRLNG